MRDAFETRKEKLRQDMQEAHSKIFISFDLWTSPNCLEILSVIAHFIDKTGKCRMAVLAFREVEGEHSGENMADILHIFNDYRIAE